MAHNITTPAGFTRSSPHGMETFQFDRGFGAKYTGKFNQAQRVIDSEVLRLNSPYVPMDSGALIRSGIANTVIGSGVVIYRTPYARRWYYEAANFQGAPMRGRFHFERMKVDHKGDILRVAGRVFHT